MKLKSILTMALAATIIGCTFSAEAKTPRKTKRSRVHTSATTGSNVSKGTVNTYGSELSTQEFTLKRGKSVISVQYPVSGNPELVAAMKSWIKSHLNDKFSGSLDSPEAIMKSAAAALERGETLNQSISVSYSNDKIITLQNNGYLDMQGAAHGMPFDVSATFLKADGSELTADILPPIARIRPLLVQGLLPYFEVSSAAQLNDCLMGVTTSDIQYGNVYISGKGLVISYGAYEIAPYASGMPQSVIPTAKLMPLLSSKAARFF